ncbi:hypothetical protein E1262_06220 [Jiangella aurantiaca]|uniref:Uncharacterized protein n=1 Tax=Jiangella aurantiaca TaxID=2530373 RepID=A0A4R5AID9_9ACTN|nr:DUF6069 family protein [Jiangella aurantiaca]TDD71216.1 hypothetical protein E1262_06220 [Jiangella aurantiaca]
MSSQSAAGSRPTVDAGRLWAGGCASALVAALTAVLGIVVARGVFDVPVLAPEGHGVWGDASTWGYAGGAALAALVATGLAHVLILTTPQPIRFLSWVVGLATVIAALIPLTSDATAGSRLATALIILAVGLVIGTLIAGVARSATRAARRLPPQPGPRPEPMP